MSPLRLLIPALRSQAPLLAAGAAGLALAALLSVLGPWLVAQAIDVDLPAADRAGLVRRCVQYVGVLVAAGALTWGSRVALEVAAQEALLGLKSTLFDHLVTHDLQLHDRTPSGSLVGRLQGDISSLRVLLVDVIFALPADVVLVIGMVTVLGVSAPRIAWPVLAVVPVYLVLLWVFRRVAAPAFLAHREQVSRLTGTLVETVGVLAAMRQLGRHLWLRDRAGDAIDATYSTEGWSRLQPTWFFNAALLVRAIAMVVVLWWGAGVVGRGEATVGALVMALAYLRQLFSPLMRVSNQLSSLEQARAAAVRIDALLREPRRILDPPDPGPWPGLHHGLAFEGVGFAYVDGTPVLRDLDLILEAGKRTGIVGSTGAGKSTVIDLLLRFRDPVTGRVTLDGVDLRELSVAELRQHIGLVRQDVQLLPGTVLDNLGGDAEAAATALHQVGLDMDLDEPLRSTQLSRGERQLLTIARALVGDPPVLVLDEATSAVDPATEARVQQALDTVLVGRTSVVVAHRLRTVRACDRIVVLDQGRVREVGTHDSLVAEGGLYAELVRLQEVA